MYDFVSRSTCSGLRVALAACSLWVGSLALAADDPAAPARAAADAQAASAPIPFNSGVPANEFAADASKVTMERKSNGTRVYHMNGQGMQSLVAHLGADGKITYSCTDQAEQIVRANAGIADER